MFFLVVVFGLFHGLVYFPILLSLIGPRGYSTAGHTAENGGMEKSPVASNGNIHIENGGNMNSVSNGNIEKGMLSWVTIHAHYMPPTPSPTDCRFAEIG